MGGLDRWGDLVIAPYGRGYSSHLNDGKIKAQALRGISKLGTSWVSSMSALPSLSCCQRCCNRTEMQIFLHLALHHFPSSLHQGGKVLNWSDHETKCSSAAVSTSSPPIFTFFLPVLSPPPLALCPGTNREKNSIAVLRTRQVFHSRPHLPASCPERPRREKMSCRNGWPAWGSASPAALNWGSSPRSGKLLEGSMA